MGTTKFSMNILLAELIHLGAGIGIGLVPWGWAPGVAFVLWKELYRDVKANYGKYGYNWLWLLPAAIHIPDGMSFWTEYRWGPGPKGAIAFQKKAWIDMAMYFAGMALGIWWQPW